MSLSTSDIQKKACSRAAYVMAAVYELASLNVSYLMLVTQHANDLVFFCPGSHVLEVAALQAGTCVTVLILIVPDQKPSEAKLPLASQFVVRSPSVMCEAYSYIPLQKKQCFSYDNATCQVPYVCCVPPIAIRPDPLHIITPKCSHALKGPLLRTAAGCL